MAEHLTHIFIEVSILAGLLIGLMALLVYLDRRGVNTHQGHRTISGQRDLRRKHVANKNVAKKKRRKK